MSLVTRALKAIDQTAQGALMSRWTGAYRGSFGWNRTTSGVRLTNDGALGLVAVYACVRVIAETVASLPLIVYRRLPDGGKERATDSEWYRVLHDQPNPDMTSFAWRETMLSHVLTWGNGYNEIAFDGFGSPQLWPIRPDRMVVYYDTDGRKAYDYLSPSGSRRTLDPATIFHIPGLSPNGLVGYSPIELHRQALGQLEAAETFGQSFFRNGARPAMVLSHPGTFKNPDTPKRLAAQMDELRGSGNAGKTIVMEEGMTLTEVGVPPEDAQYIETRKFQLREVARMYRMQPHMIGDLDNATFSNIEHQSIDFVVHTIRPWLVRLEQAISASLLWADPTLVPEFLVDGLLRGDALARAQSLEIQRRNGAVTRDEWREIENRNPLQLPDDIWQPAGTNYIPQTLGDSPTSEEIITAAQTDEEVMALPSMYSVMAVGANGNGGKR